MSIKPGVSSGLAIKGEFSFSAQAEGREALTDCYHLLLEIPEEFPRKVPCVTELDFKIPRLPKFHVNPDGTLCLGSPLRLLWKLSQNSSLPGFSCRCLVPYLYAISHKLRFGGGFVFDELDHGLDGELQDYTDLFGLENVEAARRAYQLILMKKKTANRLTCPCGCKRRLGKCEFNWTVRKFRNLLKA